MPEPTRGVRHCTPLLLCLACSLLVAGCAAYRAVPLTEQAVAAGLQPPTPEALRVAASELHHPLLAPLHLDLHDGLSPDEAAVCAVLANPELRAIRAERGVAQAGLLAAGILPCPQIDYQLDVPLGSNAAGEAAGHTLGLSLDPAALITRGVQRAGARAHAESVDLDVAWQEWQVAEEARLEVYRLGFLDRALGLARQEEEALGQSAALVRRADTLHVATAVEAAAAEAALEAARQERISTELERTRAALALNAALGLPADSSVVVQADTTRSWLLAVPPAAELRDSLEARRLDLVALRRGYQSQEAAVHAAVLRQFPAIGVGLVGTRDTGSFYTLGPSVTLRLPFLDRNQGEIARETATRRQLYWEYTARVFAARHEVDSLLVEERMAGHQLASARRLVAARQRLVDAYREARRTATADILAYYQARSDLVAAEMDVLRLEESVAELGVALEVASGTHLPAALGESDP